MGLIKSYSNYVVRKKHQLLNNGTVFERDFSTVGGVGDTFNSEYKFYRQGTFVYKISDEILLPKIYAKDTWEKNGDSCFWTKDDLDNFVGQQGSMDILLKQDFYKLKDFAYYGSCVELIRSSINGILNNFPGELCVPYVDNKGIVVFYDEYKNIKLGNIGIDYQSEDFDKYIYLVDNPFNLDVYSEEYILESESAKNIKYVKVNYQKYEFIDDNFGEQCDIKEIQVEKYDEQCYPYCFAKVTIIPENRISTNLVIKCFYNGNNEIFYLTDENGFGKHIRPKVKQFNEFYKSLDSFQKLLLNENSQPKYTTIFEVMDETEYGYQTFYKKFTFPLSYGGYNLDIESSDYSSYINSLSKYGEFFDGLYCNNLYRQMTHESIKNFDWTDTLNRGDETREDYIENGDKIEKLILLFGRELDEIKFHIDGIKNTNNITYSDSNNLPDYFLTDALEIDGWDVKNVFPYKINNNVFEEDLLLKHNPYSSKMNICGSLIDFPFGYASGFWSNNCEQSKKIVDEEYTIDKKGVLRYRIKQFINDKFYSMQDLNNKFMKQLKLNSRSILQRKGTIESIESLLSMFGLKSKRWYDSLERNESGKIVSNFRLLKEMDINYDYEIKEYVAITTPIVDGASNEIENTLPKAYYLIDHLNSTKTISYNTYDYLNGQYVPYQGLPIRYYAHNGKHYLYPYFSKNISIDGNPHYQMNGGWIHKSYTFDGVNVTDNDGGYVDTNTQISIVENLSDLLHINDEQLYDGIIYYVKNIKGEYVCVNDKIYQLEYESSNSANTNLRYFKIQVIDSEINIGTQSWYGEIKTYDEYGDLITIDLTKFKNNSYVKIFVNEENKIYVAQEDNVLINYAIFKDGNMLKSDNDIVEPIENGTNYFILYDKQWKNTLGFFGWNQLLSNSKEYETINNIKRNYKGNNPHTSGLKYDSGIEYLKYFQKLFKYALSEEAFNENCYESIDEYMSSINHMENNIGFENLIGGDECGETINLYEDNKTHHFCNYSDSGKTYYFCEIGDEYETNDYVKTYNFYNKKEYNNLNEDIILELTNMKKETCLDQIINLKNVDIIFKNNSKNEIEISKQRKYFEDVILHYLKQIIPSNIILNIKFEEYSKVDSDNDIKDEVVEKEIRVDDNELSLKNVGEVYDETNLLIEDSTYKDNTLYI